jgi:hypothetical protein
MKASERAALQHAAEELAYRRSPQAKLDAEADRKRREAADRNAGHLPTCGLTKCDPKCGHANL